MTLPTWLETLLKRIEPLDNHIEGVVQLVDGITNEIKSSDDPIQKADVILKDVADAGEAVASALNANTDKAAADPQPGNQTEPPAAG